MKFKALNGKKFRKKRVKRGPKEKNAAGKDVVSFPGFLKNSARPGYWVPDEEISNCCVCQEKFGPRLTIHHCRACGQGVCDNCSPSKRVVAFRGWDYPVRVCNKCEKKTDRI